MLKCMLPHPECETCGGRGWYPEGPGPDEGLERYCACDAGKMRREYDDGGSIEALTQKYRGRSRAEEWDRYEWPTDGSPPSLKGT